MEKVTNSRAKQKLINTGIYVTAIIIIIAFLWRIQCSISYYDEVYNIYISYITAALGQRHLVENSYIFSMGDLFNLPFVYLFYRITGGTEGIVLFIRFAYLGFNLMLSVVFLKVFGKTHEKKIMVLFGLVMITFFPGGMYTICYDTAALFFSLMGGILLLGSELRSNKSAGIYRYFAGICHACMAYSYPLMVGVIFLLVVGVIIFHICDKKIKGRDLIHYWLPYFAGGMTVFGIFLIYVALVGWRNIFFFRPGFLENGLKGREIGEIASIASSEGSPVSSPARPDVVDSPALAIIKKIGNQIFAILNYMWIQQKATLGLTLVMLVQWGIGLIKKGRWRLLIIPEILLVAFFMHTKISCYGGTTMYAYCFCWAPFLLFYLDKKERKEGNLIFLVLGIISVASFLAIGFTSVRTDKAHVGLYCGAICTFILMIMLVKDKYLAGISMSAMVILLIAICNTGMSYIDHFQGADIQDCTYRMQKGIFKGLMTWEADIQYEELKTCLENELSGNDNIISITDWNYYSVGLDGNSLVERGNMLYLEEQIQSSDNAEEVYKKYKWPEAILIDKVNEENYTNVKEKILERHYELLSSEYDYYLYIRRG